MFLLLFLPFIFRCLSASDTADLKMMVMWGSVDGGYNSPSQLIQKTWDACVNYCLEEDLCFLVQSNDSGCLLYDYSTFQYLRLTDEESGTRIALKRALSTCPVSPVMEGVTAEIYQSMLVAWRYSITATGNSWNIFFKYWIKCYDDSFVAIRGDTHVCITVRLFSDPICNNGTEGLKLCNDTDMIGITGPYSAEEGEVIGAYAAEKWAEVPMPFDYFYVNFWIDGIIVNGSYTITDRTLNSTNGYRWAKGDPAACTFLSKQSDATYVYHSSCTTTDRWTYKSYCQRGAICRKEPDLYYPPYP